jgi:hypothetical protein
MLARVRAFVYLTRLTTFHSVRARWGIPRLLMRLARGLRHKDAKAEAGDWFITNLIAMKATSKCVASGVCAAPFVPDIQALAWAR